MGCGASSTEQQEFDISNKIDEGLQKDREDSKREVKLLLLGNTIDEIIRLIVKLLLLGNKIDEVVPLISNNIESKTFCC